MNAYLGDCSKIFYNHLQIKNKVIALKEIHEIDEIHHEKILNCTFILICNETVVKEQELKTKNIDDDNLYVYKFNNINDIHFIVPFIVNLETITLCVHIPGNENYILYKTFFISNNHQNNKIRYFLNMIEMYQYEITDSKDFFDKIGIQIGNNDIEIIENSKNLLNFVFYGSSIKKSRSGKTVLHRLVNDLNITQLSNIYKQSFTARYVPIILSNDDQFEYKLISGYLREMEETLNLSSIIPSTLMKLIVLYQQCQVIRGNDLCLIHPKQRLIKTKMVTTHHTEHSFIIISQSLNTGIWNFKINCIADAKLAVSIGIITNIDANVNKTKYFFDDEECGDSYQLYLSTSTKRYANSIYHHKNGKILYEEPVDTVKSGALLIGECLEMITDFDQYQVKFLVDSKQCGKSIEIEKNTTYFAAFAMVPNNIYFHRSGHAAFQFSLQ